MAAKTYRYRSHGVGIGHVRRLVDPGALVSAPSAVLTVFVTVDETRKPDLDVAMADYGYDYDATVDVAPTTGEILFTSPDGSLWRLQIDNFGVLTTTKIV